MKVIIGTEHILKFMNPVLELCKMHPELDKYGRVEFDADDYLVTLSCDCNRYELSINISGTVPDNAIVIMLRNYNNVRERIEIQDLSYNNGEFTKTRCTFSNINMLDPMMYYKKTRSDTSELFSLDFTEEQYFQMSTLYNLYPLKDYENLRDIFIKARSYYNRDFYLTTNFVPCEVQPELLEKIYEKTWSLLPGLTKL